MDVCIAILAALALALVAWDMWRDRAEGYEGSQASAKTMAAIKRCRAKGKIWDAYAAKGKKCTKKGDKRKVDRKVQDCRDRGGRWFYDTNRHKCLKMSRDDKKARDQTASALKAYSKHLKNPSQKSNRPEWMDRGFKCPPDKLRLSMGTNAWKCVSNQQCFDIGGKNIQEGDSSWSCKCGDGTYWTGKQCQCNDNHVWDGSSHTCHPK